MQPPPTDEIIDKVVPAVSLSHQGRGRRGRPGLRPGGGASGVLAQPWRDGNRDVARCKRASEAERRRLHEGAGDGPLGGTVAVARI